MATRYRYGKLNPAKLSARRQRDESIKWNSQPVIAELAGQLGGFIPSTNPTGETPKLSRATVRNTPGGVATNNTILYHFIIDRFTNVGAGTLRMWSRYKAVTNAYVVRSSFIHTVMYNASAQCIVVVMRASAGGASYYYRGKTPQDFQMFVAALSKGVFYNQNIRGKNGGGTKEKHSATSGKRW